VLIADDHALIREGLSELLGQYPDIEVVGLASEGNEAVRLAGELQPDVAIFDIMMPGLNGIDATTALAQRAAGVRAVMLSMHSGYQHVKLALAAGARGYLLKQSASREIAAAVRAVRAGKRYFCAEVEALLSDEDGPDGAEVSPLQKLSSRERQVLQLVAEGRSSAEIGGQLHLSAKTVDTYRSRMMQKLGLSDIAAVVRFAILHGITPLQ
jgi:DNA-binding NarL/FixJ family response regulator